MKNLVIVGNGGFAKEVKWLVDRINVKNTTWNFLGYIDKDKYVKGVIGNDEFLLSYKDKLAVALSIGTSYNRKRLYDLYKTNSNLYFPNLIDPDVLLSESVSMGIGNIICAGCIMTVDITVGNGNIINLDCTIGHDVIIDDFVTINPGANVSGNVHLQTCVEIGTGTQIIQGKTVGCGSRVGAGAVVVSNLPEYCTAVGMPAKPINIK